MEHTITNIPTTLDHTDLLAAVSFSGRDAASFLQGQLTGNTQTLQRGRWRRAAYCSRQGRVLANGMLCHLPSGDDDDRFLFIVSADLAEDVVAQLKRYILRAKVRAEVAPYCFAYATEKAARTPPAEGAIGGEGGAWALDGGEGWTLYLGDAASSPTGKLANGDWAETEILRGTPWVSGKTQGLFIPQFINFELIGGVDFEKGCYVGQEVIARLHHLGKVKYRALIARGNGASPQAAAALTTADGKKAGEVINAVANDGGFIALASVGVASAALQLDGIPVRLSKPPYPLPELA